ncbi:TPA: hypothetical protein WLY43_000881, partial [Neisseria gonorrhoeae]
MNGLIKNPKLIAVSVCAVFVAGAWQYDRAAQYRRGYGAAVSEVSERLKAAAVEHAEHARKSSAAYQAQKAAREE